MEPRPLYELAQLLADMSVKRFYAIADQVCLFHLQDFNIGIVAARRPERSFSSFRSNILKLNFNNE
jgi:hypothetical protein